MLNLAIETAIKAGRVISKRASDNLKIEHKGRIDLVTNADRISQEIIIREIEKRYPRHAIIAEEGIEKKGKEDFSWYIDPIDGTTNFVHGVPVFCVSIALYKNKMPLLGVCYNPISRELFHAEKNGGAFLNGKQIMVSSAAKMIDALVVTGFPYKSNDLKTIVKIFFKVLSRAQGIRRFGSAALDLCYVACGKFDAFWELNLKPWDMAAGVLILQEAGGTVTCADGSRFALEKSSLAASNSLLHKEFLRLLKL